MLRIQVRILVVLAAFGLACPSVFALAKQKAPGKKAAAGKAKKVARATPKAVSPPHSKAVRASYLVGHSPASRNSRQRTRRVAYNPWTEPTYAESSDGDRVDGDDLAVRRAAVDALGRFNGSIVAVDPGNGRVLTIVNQKLAFKSGFQPCSTIKLVAALAGLNEGVIERTTMVPLGRRYSMDLTTALAHSNNAYFATIGNRLGFERVSQYARRFGLGEKACLNCPEEEPGVLPATTPAEGMGMMTSFGSGINLTPLQLAALISAMANGGTLYQLQYPHSREEALSFSPKVKRQLEIANLVDEVKPGMEGAVEYGTARRANYDPNEPIFGKTGTCSDVRSPGIHLGWFGSFNEIANKKLVVVVLLTGGGGINGPVAAGVAGTMYRTLSGEGYFERSKSAALPQADAPVAVFSAPD